jgi:predicted dehydrogenase
MGFLHAGIINALPNCKVTAVCESESMIVRMATKLMRDVSFYKNVSEMIEEEAIDAAFITSPIHTHAPIIRSLLKSNATLGVFSEKPLAANGSDALEVAQAVTKLGVANMVGFHKRFSPFFRHVKQLIDAKAIGELQCFKCYSYTSDIFHKGTGWRFLKGTGGVLLDLGPHLLDLLLWYFGEPERVSAVERSLYSTEVEDYVHAIVKFHSGLVGSLNVSWSQRGYRLPEIFIEVQGTNGSIFVSDDYAKLEIDKSIKDVIEAGRRTLDKGSFDTSVDFLLADPEYTIEDKYFLNAIMEGSKQVEPNFLTAAHVNEFVDLIHKEAR